MLMHPPVLALLMMAFIVALAAGWAACFAFELLRHWNPELGTRRQIELERRTQLVATVVAQVLLLQGLALLLMIHNAGRIAPLLVGAMCAFGSFNASVYGFPALYAKLALFFGAGTWLALHRADLVATDYPLTRRKYLFLLALAPVALADACLTLAYYIDLQPDTLTSCCGSTFQADRPGLAAEVSAVEPRKALWALAIGMALVLAWGRGAKHSSWMAGGYALVSAVFLGVALVGMVAGISPYVYGSPHHHCPFCLLEREYGYFGYALYAPLFTGASAGLSSGVLSMRPPSSLAAWLPTRAAQLRRISMTGFLVFSVLAGVAVMMSDLRL